jgi:hypothetical protein
MNPRPIQVSGRRCRAAPTSALALFLALGAAACDTTYKDHVIDPGQVYEGQPLVSPLPLTVGLHYGSALRGYEVDVSRSAGSRVDRYHLRLGAASMALFDRILAAQFAAVCPVEDVPTSAADRPGLDAVIDVSIRSAGLMSVDYDLTLYTPRGSVIATFDANGSIYTGDLDEETVMRGLRVAMRNAAAKFLVEFPGDPDVVAWLQRSDSGASLAMEPAPRLDEPAE